MPFLARLAICLGLISPLFVAPAGAATSEEALAALQKELANDDADLAALAEKDFARTPLIKADAARARALVWKRHAARIAK
jgi:hypothetical protein